MGTPVDPVPLCHRPFPHREAFSIIMGPALSLLAGIVIVLIITAFTGWFVAQEFAFMAVDRSRTAARAKGGDDKAAKTLQVTRSTSFMLSGAQLGITVTGLVVGYVAEPLIGGAIRDMGSAAGISKAFAAVVGAVVALLLQGLIQVAEHISVRRLQGENS